MRVRVRSTAALEFACHSKKCAPPPAGTGGSTNNGKNKKGKVKVPKGFSYGVKHTKASRKWAKKATKGLGSPHLIFASAAQEELACHSKACAPPPAGSGGSNPKGGAGGGAGSPRGGGSGGGSSTGDRFDDEVEYEQELRRKRKAEEAATPHIVNAWESPHFKVRTAADVGAMSEDDAIQLIRDNDATGRRILDKGAKIIDTQAVGVRANLNVKKTTGITVQTMHQGTSEQLRKGTGMFNGEAIGYGAAPMLRNANFSVNQKARAAIASGEKNKFPMASVDGQYQSPTTPNGQRAQGSKFNGVEITFNPMKNHTFVDPDGRAVKSATDVTVAGSKVYARGRIEYYTPDNMPKAERDIPTESHT